MAEHSAKLAAELRRLNEAVTSDKWWTYLDCPAVIGIDDGLVRIYCHNRENASLIAFLRKHVLEIITALESDQTPETVAVSSLAAELRVLMGQKNAHIQCSEAAFVVRDFFWRHRSEILALLDADECRD